MVACEEDFRLFLEEGKGRKIYFNVSNKVHHNQAEGCEPMEAENIEPERKTRKGNKDDEKRCRRYEKLSKKLKHYEEACKNEEERSRFKQWSEKRGVKNCERLERARRRVEQIRSIIGSIDPANLNSSNDNSVEQATSSDTSVPTIQSPISPDTIRLLSNAIAGCLQPCNVINKVLNEVFAIIPQVVEQTTEVLSNVDQQQQTSEVPKNTTATNTSDANTPVLMNPTSQEIEELFKEAAKELEKMNEIVNNSNKMDESILSLASETTQSGSQITQIEKVFQNITDSAISNATIIDNFNDSTDQIDSSSFVNKSAPNNADESIIGTPKFVRSRESSIEIHDVNSLMSDDSRDWTILSQDDVLESTSQRNVDPKTGAIPKNTFVANNDLPTSSSSQCDAEIQTNESNQNSIKSISIETQTPSSILSELSNQEKLQASVQKSIGIVQKSIESIHMSMGNPEIQKAASDQENIKPSPVQDDKRIDIYPSLQPTADRKSVV